MNKPSSNTFLRLFHTRWFFIVNLVLIVIVVFSFAREVIHGRDIHLQIQSLQTQSRDLHAQNLAIADLKNVVETESYAESQARLKLGLKKPGESVVILKNEKGSGLNPPSSASGDIAGTTQSSGGLTDQTKNTLANSTKWWYYFFNKQLYREAE